MKIEENLSLVVKGPFNFHFHILHVIEFYEAMSNEGLIVMDTLLNMSKQISFD